MLPSAASKPHHAPSYPPHSSPRCFQSISPFFTPPHAPFTSVSCRKVSVTGRFAIAYLTLFLSLTILLLPTYVITTIIHASANFFHPKNRQKFSQNAPQTPVPKVASQLLHSCPARIHSHPRSYPA